MSQGNMESLKALLLDGFGKQDMTVVDRVVATDLVERQLGLPQGREGLKNVIRMLHGAFPDLTYSVVQMVEDGEKVWGHFRSRGTHRGDFMGHAATNRTFEIDVVDIARFERGQIVEHWGVPDRLGLLMQLGLMP